MLAKEYILLIKYFFLIIILHKVEGEVRLNISKIKYFKSANVIGPETKLGSGFEF